MQPKYKHKLQACNNVGGKLTRSVYLHFVSTPLILRLSATLSSSQLMRLTCTRKTCKHVKRKPNRQMSINAK